MLPFFDPSKLTDKEIIEKLSELHMYYDQHVSLGHTELIHNMNLYIAILQEEQEYRMLKQMEEERKASAQKNVRKKVKMHGKIRVTEPPKPKSDAIILGRIEGVDD